jgi:hypothetical protein
MLQQQACRALLQSGDHTDCQRISDSSEGRQISAGPRVSPCGAYVNLGARSRAVSAGLALFFQACIKKQVVINQNSGMFDMPRRRDFNIPARAKDPETHAAFCRSPPVLDRIDLPMDRGLRFDARRGRFSRCKPANPRDQYLQSWKANRAALSSTAARF